MVRLGQLSRESRGYLPLPPQCWAAGTSPYCFLTQVLTPKPGAWGLPSFLSVRFLVIPTD